MSSGKVPAFVSPQLDSLRGMSALAVLLAHANQILVGPTWPGLYTAAGLLAQAAVMMFFALSGFLICKAITGNAARHDGFRPATYAADRFNRIVPPLAFSLVLVAVLWAAAPLLFPSGSREFAVHYPFDARAGFDVQLPAWLGSAVFLNGFLTGHLSANGPLWSLSFEVWYYVAAGLIAALRARGLVLAVSMMVLLGWVNHDFLLLSVVWFAGAVVALVHNSGRSLTWISRPTGAVCLAAAAFLGYSFVVDNAQARSAQELVSRAIPYYNVYIGLFFAAVLYEVVLGNVKVPTFARHSAGYSYTLYIIHFPILLVVYGALQSHIQGSLLASLGAGVGAALGCWLMARFLARWLESWRPLNAARTSNSAALLPR